ncbi:MAG: TPM domain-containing protein [Verrucomicrobiota bacterium]
MKPADTPPDGLDDQAVLRAIQSAESTTSGEIRVAVAAKPASDPAGAARQAFDRLGMERTPMRNAVLLYLAPSAGQVAVVADETVVFRCGPDFGREAERSIATALRRGRLTAGVVDAIRRLGERLAAHFPPSRAERNDFPDQVIRL